MLASAWTSRQTTSSSSLMEDDEDLQEDYGDNDDDEDQQQDTESKSPWQVDWKNPQFDRLPLSININNTNTKWSHQWTILSTASAQLDPTEVQPLNILPRRQQQAQQVNNYILHVHLLCKTGTSDIATAVVGQVISANATNNNHKISVESSILVWPQSIGQESKRRRNSRREEIFVRFSPHDLPVVGIQQATLMRHKPVSNLDQARAKQVVEWLNLGVGNAKDVDNDDNDGDANQATLSAAAGATTPQKTPRRPRLLWHCVATNGQVYTFDPLQQFFANKTKEDHEEDLIGQSMASLFWGAPLVQRIQESIVPLSQPMSALPLSVLEVKKKKKKVTENNKTSFWQQWMDWDPTIWDTSTQCYKTADNHVTCVAPCGPQGLAIGGQGSQWVPPKSQGPAASPAASISSRGSVHSRAHSAESGEWRLRTGGFVTFSTLVHHEEDGDSDTPPYQWAEERTVFLPFPPKHLSLIHLQQDTKTPLCLVLGAESHQAVGIALSTFTIAHTPESTANDVGAPLPVRRLQTMPSVSDAFPQLMGSDPWVPVAPDKNNDKKDDLNASITTFLDESIQRIRRFQLLPLPPLLEGRIKGQFLGASSDCVSAVGRIDPPALVVAYSDVPASSSSLSSNHSMLLLHHRTISPHLVLMPPRLVRASLWSNYPRVAAEIDCDNMDKDETLIPPGSLWALETNHLPGHVAKISVSSPPQAIVAQGWSVLLEPRSGMHWICWDGSDPARGAAVVSKEGSYESSLDNEALVPQCMSSLVLPLPCNQIDRPTATFTVPDLPDMGEDEGLETDEDYADTQGADDYGVGASWDQFSSPARKDSQLFYPPLIRRRLTAQQPRQASTPLRGEDALPSLYFQRSPLRMGSLSLTNTNHSSSMASASLLGLALLQQTPDGSSVYTRGDSLALSVSSGQIPLSLRNMSLSGDPDDMDFELDDDGNVFFAKEYLQEFENTIRESDDLVLEALENMSGLSYRDSVAATNPPPEQTQQTTPKRDLPTRMVPRSPRASTTTPPNNSGFSPVRKRLSQVEKTEALLQKCPSWMDLEQTSEYAGLLDRQVPMVAFFRQGDNENSMAWLLSLREKDVLNGPASPFHEVLTWLSGREDFFMAASIALDLLGDSETLYDLWKPGKAKTELGYDGMDEATLEGLLDGISRIPTDILVPKVFPASHPRVAEALVAQQREFGLEKSSTDTQLLLVNPMVLHLADMTIGCLVKGGHAMSDTLKSFLNRNLDYDQGKASLMLVACVITTMTDVMGDARFDGNREADIARALWPVDCLLQIGISRNYLPKVLSLLNASVPDELRHRPSQNDPSSSPLSGPPMPLCMAMLRMILQASPESAPELLLDLVDDMTRSRFWQSLTHATRLPYALVQLQRLPGFPQGYHPLLEHAEVREWCRVQLNAALKREDSANANVLETMPTEWLQRLVLACLSNAQCSPHALLEKELEDKTIDDNNSVNAVSVRLKHQELRRERILSTLTPPMNSGKALDFDLILPALLLLKRRNELWMIPNKMIGRKANYLTTQSLLEHICRLAGRKNPSPTTTTDDGGGKPNALVVAYSFDASTAMKQCALAANVRAGAFLVGGTNGFVLQCADLLTNAYLESDLPMVEAEHFLRNPQLDVQFPTRHGPVPTATTTPFVVDASLQELLALLDQHVMHLRTFGDFETHQVRGRVDPVFAASCILRCWWAMTTTTHHPRDATTWLTTWLTLRLDMATSHAAAGAASRYHLVCAALTRVLVWSSHSSCEESIIQEQEEASSLARAMGFESWFLASLSLSSVGMAEAVPDSVAKAIVSAAASPTTVSTIVSTSNL